MIKTDSLSKKLARHYKHFDVENRLLFTGHSHQAWPDVAMEGLADAFQASARLVDHKWELAFQKTEVLRSYLRDYYDDPDGQYSLAENTHHLIVKWLSALNLREKPRIVTTDGEFYSLFRQLTRLGEENIEVVFVPALPLDGIANRIRESLDKKTSAVMISRVYFETSLINQEITEVASHCRDFGIPLLIDDYHGTNVVPISLRQTGLEDIFVLIGGYKYLQWGEGNCFLRYPANCKMRPVITGWFASFSTLRQPRSKTVQYDGGDALFMGATFDATSQFRAARVVEFFRDQGLTRDVLFDLYRSQTDYMREVFLNSGFDPKTIRLKHNYSMAFNGGFLALESEKASFASEELKKRDIYTDFRGNTLRFGPAPYTTSAQIDQVFKELKNVLS